MKKEDLQKFSDTSDSELISMILQGSKNLYEIIIRRYNQRLYRVGMSMINDEAEVEDIMQVAYINAYENLGKFVFKSKFSTWLTRILINECLLRIRNRNRSVVMDDEKLVRTFDKPSYNHSQTPVHLAMNSELKSIIHEAINRLPEKYRTVFVMREIEDMNVTETKECLDISEVNVKVRLNRAKIMLREIISAYYKREDILHFHLSKCDRIVAYVMGNI
ncbi:MAG TPA: RNA polymerase sigma factor [Sediminibacterium sp.]